MIHRGYIKKAVDERAYVLGGGQLPETILVPNSNWIPFAPPEEAQAKNGLETDGCTLFNSLNAIEMLYRRLFLDTKEYSERFIGVLANVSPPGADPHYVLETIRKNGLIEDSLLPFDDSIKSVDQFYAPKPMRADFWAKALGWLQKFNYGHEYVGTDKVSLQKALQFSPVNVAVYAWVQNSEGLYYTPDGVGPGHWTTLVKYEGDNPIIYDSYAPYIKKLTPDFRFFEAKRHHLELRKTPISKPLFSWVSLLSVLRGILHI